MFNRRALLTTIGLAITIMAGVVVRTVTHAQAASYSNITVTSVTATTATISWNTTPGFCTQLNYGTVAGGLDQQFQETGTCAATSHSHQLTGLNPGAQYFFQLVGPGVVSSQLNFLLTIPVISELSTRNITDTTATIHWKTDVAACGKVRYGITANALSSTIDTCANGAPASTTNDIQIASLTPGQAYFYEVIFMDPCFNRCTAVTVGNQQFRTVGNNGTSVPVGNNTGVNITAVNIVSTNDTSASISFSYSGTLVNAMDYVVNYGTSATYTNHLDTKRLPLAVGSEPFVIANLASGTTYHFSIKILDASGKTLALSADRTFATARQTSGSSQISIDRIRVDCIDSSCTVFFNTSAAARVEVKWSTNVFSFADALPSVIESSYTSGYRSMRFPTSGSLIANTLYHYRLQATTTQNASTVTGDLTLQTSANSTDHTFATGECHDTNGNSADVGSCIGTQLCFTAGNLVNDCTKCGSICGAGQTCRPGSPNLCRDDLALTGAPSQCNDATCYTPSGQFITPAAANCSASWPRCTANTILKVQKDRGCNIWLSCATSIQTTSSTGKVENICLSLGACNSLNDKGQCNHYLPYGQCSNEPLRFCSDDEDCMNGGTCNNPDPSQPTKSLQDVTYQTPSQVKQVANLSGNVLAGLDWGQQGGANVIKGGLPLQLMRQIGGNAEIRNGDFEYQAPSTDPWTPVPVGMTPPESLRLDFEDRDIGPNHVLVVDPITQIVDKRCANDANRQCTASTDCAANAACGDTTVDVPFSGAASSVFTAQPSEYYYAEAKIRALNSGSPVVRMQFGHKGYTTFSVPNADGTGNIDTFVQVNATAAWQRVTLGPLRGMSGETRLAFVCDNKSSCSAFEVDDVIVKPILQTNTNPTYITPSCRLYPKNDSPSCDYADTNGVVYKGWKGYCLEHDSQTGTCLSWWPVDVLKGESSIFGSEKTGGYQDRSPLYFCAESAGLAKKSEVGDSQFTSKIGYMYGDKFDGSNTFTISDRTYGTTSSDATLSSIQSNAGHVTSSLNKAAIKGIDGYGYTSDGQKWLQYFHFESEDFTATSTEKTFETGGGYMNIVLRATTLNPVTLNKPVDYTVWQIDTKGCTLPSVAPGGELPGPNCIILRFIFNAEGFLVEEQFDGADFEGQNVNPIQYDILFQVREVCSTLVQVVSSSGENSSFASRVQSNTFKIPDLNYNLSTDLKPFGGALQPALYASDPTQWPPIETQRANSAGGGAGQARAGSPYACNGNCSTFACIVHTPQPAILADINTATGVCATNPKNCQNIDSDGDGIGDGQCVGLGNQITSNLGQQLLNGTVSCIKTPPATTGYCGGNIKCSDASPISAICNATKTITATGSTVNAALQNAANTCGFTATSSSLRLGGGTLDAQSGTEKGVACDGTIATCTGTKAYYNRFDQTGQITCTRNGLSTLLSNCTTVFGRSQCTCTVTGICQTTGAGRNYTQGQVDAAQSTSCSSDGDCLNVPGVDPKQNFAAEHIKRVFTKTFGVWSNKRCSTDETLGCVVTADCTTIENGVAVTHGTCSITKGTYGRLASSTEGAGKTFSGWNPPSELCPVNPASLGNQCGSQTQACTQNATVTATSSLADETAARNEAIKNMLGQCGLTVGAADPIVNPSRVVTNATPDLKADGSPKVTACNGVSTQCPGVANQYEGGTIVPYTALTLDNACSKVNGVMRCTGRCTSNRSYIQAGLTDASRAAPYLRPPFVAGSTGDYCGIPPTVSNVSFSTGTAKVANITGGSGSVAIKFNTNADTEQVPLQKIRIDWGDAQDDFAFPYAPRNDTSKPHVFSHTYVVNRGDTDHCKPFGTRTACEFPIKIQVVDSWGWCSDASAVANGPDVQCQGGTLGNGRIDSAKWFDSGLKVIVQP